MSDDDPHRGQPVLAAGIPIEKAAAAMILLHGRGASAEDILSLAQHFYRDDVARLSQLLGRPLPWRNFPEVNAAQGAG